MKPDKPEKEWWEESFDEEFPYKIDGTWNLLESIKSFIRKVAAQSEKKGSEDERGRIIKIAEGMQPILYHEDANQHLRNISRAETLKEVVLRIEKTSRSSEEGKTNNK